SCRSRAEATGRSRVMRSTRCLAAARPLTAARFRSSAGPRGRLLGLYATRGSRARPYRTLLGRIEPLDGSCECADFLRNSLGLCKHLVAVVEEVVSKGRRA